MVKMEKNPNKNRPCVLFLSSLRSACKDAQKVTYIFEQEMIALDIEVNISSKA